MAETRYLTVIDIIALHARIMERVGVPPAAVRDMGLLESAIMRPQMAAHYEQADLVKQAVLLAIGIAQAQAFLNGKKQTANIACDSFLRLNGLAFGGDPLNLAKQLEAAAERAGSLSEAGGFSEWGGSSLYSTIAMNIPIRGVVEDKMVERK